jgi:hypothetical protein
MDQAKS